MTARGAEVSEVYGFSNYFNPSTPFLAADGNYYGTAGGAVNTGMVFRVTADGVFTHFAGLDAGLASPFRGGPFIQDSEGNLYGTARTSSTIFKVTTNGVVTLLASLNGTNGQNPSAGLIFGPDGNMYGTATYGGTNSNGTVFKVDFNGVVTRLVSFTGPNGIAPNAPLRLDMDGNLYGTTTAGGAHGAGTVFRIATNGTLMTLFSFGGADGGFPYSALVQVADGTLYGTTAQGGAFNYGTIFRVTTNGAFMSLASFNGTNGANPYAGLVQGSDGVLYGTTSYGGSGYDGTENSGLGTVFRLGTNGEIITLGQFNGVDGAHSFNGLAQGPDGYLYGTCTFGGSHQDGAVFRVANRVRLHVTRQANGDRSLGWNTVDGLTYQLQYSQDLGSTTWSNLDSALVATNATISVIDSAKDDRRFYRVVESQ